MILALLGCDPVVDDVVVPPVQVTPSTSETSPDLDTGESMPDPLTWAEPMVPPHDTGPVFVAAVDVTGEAVSTWINDGLGKPHGLGKADVNGDGVQDLAIYEDLGSGIRFLFGPVPDGDHLFSEAGALVQSLPYTGFAGIWGLGDSNGDGVDDLVVYDDNEGRPALYLGPFSGAVVPTQRDALIEVRSPWVVLDDFTGDGLADVVVSSESEGTDLTRGLWVIPGPVADGAGDESVISRITSLTSARAVGDGRLADNQVADLTGDGVTDVVVVSDHPETLFDAPWVIGGPLESGGALEEIGWLVAPDRVQDVDCDDPHVGADIDGDGYGDLVMFASEQCGGEVKALWVMGPMSPEQDRGGSITFVSEFGSDVGAACNPSDARIADAADMDGDGDDDLLLNMRMRTGDDSPYHVVVALETPEAGVYYDEMDRIELTNLTTGDITDEVSTRMRAMDDWDGDGLPELAVDNYLAPAGPDGFGQIDFLSSGSYGL